MRQWRRRAQAGFREKRRRGDFAGAEHESNRDALKALILLLLLLLMLMLMLMMMLMLMKICMTIGSSGIDIQSEALSRHALCDECSGAVEVRATERQVERNHAHVCTT